MSAKGIAKAMVFEGATKRFEVPPAEWCEMLLLLEDFGWQPKNLRVSYIATEVLVSKEESVDLAKAGRRVLDAALKDPARVYPASFDMAKLREFVEFSEAGQFQRSQ